MKVSDYIVRFLYKKGVRHIFELSGGMTTHILNSLSEFEKIEVISMHHEQAAAFAADAMGRITKVPGVALATSGPGAINLLTGIGSAYFDSSPTIFITGQVNVDEIRSEDSRLRQLGFQEANIIFMAMPITKASILVMHKDHIKHSLLQAFEIATCDRPGPVLIDIPMDIQRSDIEVEDGY